MKQGSSINEPQITWNLKGIQGWEQKVWLGKEKYIGSIDFPLNEEVSTDLNNTSLTKPRSHCGRWKGRVWNPIQFPCVEKQPSAAIFHSMVNKKINHYLNREESIPYYNLSIMHSLGAHHSTFYKGRVTQRNHSLHISSSSCLRVQLVILF